MRTVSKEPEGGKEEKHNSSWKWGAGGGAASLGDPSPTGRLEQAEVFRLCLPLGGKTVLPRFPGVQRGRVRMEVE